MEKVLLGRLGECRTHRTTRPPMALADLDARVKLLQFHSIEKSTRKSYATGARDYINFCTTHSLPLDPTPQTLARYIAFTSRSIASARKYLTGARHFLSDLYPSFDANRAHPLVQAILTGSRKLRADPVHRKLPLRLSHLQSFLHIARKTRTFDDLLFVVILSCAFYGCHRIGELVINNDKSLFDWRKIIKRSSLHFNSHRRTQYTLPYHKADRLFRGSNIFFIHQDVADPTSLLREYIQWRDSIHHARPALFMREDGSHPTRSWFESKLFTIVDRSFGGQSARAGGATFYASLGLSEDVIQALGRWSSKAWKDYIRDNPSVRAELQLASLRERRL